MEEEKEEKGVKQELEKERIRKRRKKGAKIKIKVTNLYMFRGLFFKKRNIVLNRVFSDRKTPQCNFY